jgi:hypothetical protein
MAQRPGTPFPISPAIEPMLAKLTEALPAAGAYLFEPKWDGFRAIVFRGASELFMQSRDLRPLDRYFPELHDALLERLPADSVVDGEVVIPTAHGLDFDALQLRLHPAASRVAKLAKETPASFVAFDLLAAGGQSRMEAPQSERRSQLERLLADARSPLQSIGDIKPRYRTPRALLLPQRQALDHHRRAEYVIENLIGTVRHLTRNVKRWRDGAMIRRWVGLALGRAATRFRRIKGHGELATLATALRTNKASEAAA